MSDHQLKPIGDVIKTSEDGYLVKTASKATLQAELIPVIEELVSIATATFGTNLHSVYIRGSVAKGTFIPNLSDLDAVAVTTKDCGDAAEQTYVAAVKTLEQKRPEIVGIEKAILTKGSFLNSKNPIFKYQTVCVYGEDLALQMPAMRPGQDTMVHLPKVLERVKESVPKIQDSDQKYIKEWSIWICKQLIRSCHELLAEKLQQFARDIYPCYKAAADAFPEHEPLLRRTAEIAVYGTEDREELLDIIEQMHKLLEPKIVSVST